MTESIKYVRELLKKATSENSGFAYLGNFDDNITEHIVDLNRSSGSLIVGTDKKMAKRMSFLLVESYQNLVRHTGETNFGSALGRGMFSFQITEDGYDIDSLNVVEREVGLQVEGTIKYLNSLGEDELDATYRMKLEQSSQIEGKGAGLGLIEIARKSGRKVWGKIYPENETEVLLHQHVYHRNDNSPQVNPELHSQDAVNQLREMTKSGILLQFHGSFKRDSIHPLFNILRENIMAVHSKDLKRVGSVMLEMLQNIAKHGIEDNGASSGVFTISRTPTQSEYKLTSGNMVSAESAAELNAVLTMIEKMSVYELGEEYKNRVKAGIESEEMLNSGLGLMEIAKYSKNLWQRELTPIPETGNVFFSLSVVIA